MSAEFIKLNALKVSQNGGQHRGMFVCKMKFTDLKQIYRLTERKENSIDPFEELKPQSKSEMLSLFADYEEEFQRHLNIAKLKEIKKFVIDELAKESDNPLFPSSLILSIQLNDEFDEIEGDIDINKLYINSLEFGGAFLFKKKQDEDFQKILIPKIEKSCLIVDGQHRFSGIKKYYDELLHDQRTKLKIDNFEFVTTLLIGYDIFEVAQVFANVNFTQKPVNKSLYYDIFGSPANSKSDIQLAHFLTLHVNNNEDSPLKGMIKLLGRGEGLFSQAFFVEKLLIHFSRNGVWHEMYERYMNGGDEYLRIPIFLKLYFTQISLSFERAWPKTKLNNQSELVYTSKSYDYILCKTTGMGAFMRLIRHFYPKFLNKNEQEMKLYLKECFEKIDSGDMDRLFHKEGKYGKGGSEGFQIRLYKELLWIFFM